MRIIDRYIGKQVLSSTLFAVAVLSFVLVLGNIFQKMMGLLVQAQVPASLVFRFVGYILPFSFVFTIPWGFLTAILLVFGRLSADNELVSLRMAGMSIRRICLSVFLLALLFSGICFWINVDVAPRAEAALQGLKYETAMQNPLSVFVPDQVTEVSNYRIYVEEKEGNELTNFQMVETAGKRSLMFVAAKTVFVRPFEERGEIELEMHGAEIKRTPPGDDEGDGDDDNSDTPEQQSFVAGVWTHVIPLAELAKRNDRVRPSAMGTLDLLRRSREGDLPADQRSSMQVEIHKRFSFSLACVTFALIGIPLGITAQRRETSIGFALSLIVAAVYFMFIIVADWFKKSPESHPELLMWLPNVLFLGLGAWLFRRLDRR